jgi:hypothetical protein
MSKAVTFYKMGAPRPALDQLQQILRLHPDNAEALRYRKIMIQALKK